MVYRSIKKAWVESFQFAMLVITRLGRCFFLGFHGGSTGIPLWKWMVYNGPSENHMDEEPCFRPPGIPYRKYQLNGNQQWQATGNHESQLGCRKRTWKQQERTSDTWAAWAAWAVSWATSSWLRHCPHRMGWLKWSQRNIFGIPHGKLR